MVLESLVSTSEASTNRNNIRSRLSSFCSSVPLVKTKDANKKKVTAPSCSSCVYACVTCGNQAFKKVRFRTEQDEVPYISINEKQSAFLELSPQQPQTIVREFIKRSYKHSDVIFWNQLPNEAKLTEPMHSFREYIKTNRDLPCHNISQYQ